MPKRPNSRSKSELAHDELHESILAAVDRRRGFRDAKALDDEIERLIKREQPLLKALPDD